jgi:hypothetical protein
MSLEFEEFRFWFWQQYRAVQGRRHELFDLILFVCCVEALYLAPVRLRFPAFLALLLLGDVACDLGSRTQSPDFG